MIQGGHCRLRYDVTRTSSSRPTAQASQKPFLDGEPISRGPPVLLEAEQGFSADQDVRRDAYLKIGPQRFFASTPYGHHAVWQFNAGGKAARRPRTWTEERWSSRGRPDAAPAGS
ncbi:DUF4038 domain-containing protein [Pseudonocardia sp. MCCB 268]|nr:DUF4038 domain-containing protein [Pseudonocardia cytotoxica]